MQAKGAKTRRKLSGARRVDDRNKLRSIQNRRVVWVKTDAGRAEVQLRAHLKDRHVRALLVLVDGKQTEQALLARLPGSSPDDFQRLSQLGLITAAPAGAAVPAALATGRQNAQPESPAAVVTPAERAELVTKVRRVISAHLGLGGLSLTLSLDQISTKEEFAQIARRALEQIAERYGPQGAAAAREALRGLVPDE